MGQAEIRYLLDTYHAVQGARVATAARARARGQGPDWAKQLKAMEHQLGVALKKEVARHPVGQWMLSKDGIGPVLAAGLLAYIDITEAPTVGHIWSFAGLNPTAEWSPGGKRPWNGELKRICWKIGESFVKAGGPYRKIYLKRKEYEQAKNDGGEYAAQAAEHSARVGKSTVAYRAYSQGKLPAAHIHERAKRYAVKLFLAHLHTVWYKHHHGRHPPRPYATAGLR